MVSRNLRTEHRFVCLTDQSLRGVETINVQPYPRLKAWWNKVRLFDPALGLRGRIVYLDLDVLVVGDLLPVAEFPAPLALIPTAGRHVPTDEVKKVVRRYNSSVMVWDAGTRPEIYQRWTPKVAGRLWGDQDWIGELCPDEARMPLEWFPRLSETPAACPPPPARVVLAKKPKNHVAATTTTWVRRVWT